MPKYIVKSPINFDGTRREIDEEVELKAGPVVDGLLSVGAIAPAPTTDTRKKKGDAESE